MTRCEDFYKKWEQDPNWCLKCDTSVYYIDRYLELTAQWPQLKVFPERTLRPLFLKRYTAQRQRICYRLSARLAAGAKPDGQLIHETVKEFTMVKTEPAKPELRPVEKRVLEAAAWKQRMEPTVSRMDEEVYAELQQRGVHGMFQEQIPIGFCRPDILLDKKGRAVAVFLDGPVHEGREDRDQAARQLLARRGITILEISYGEYSPARRDQIVTEILNYMGA